MAFVIKGEIEKVDNEIEEATQEFVAAAENVDDTSVVESNEETTADGLTTPDEPMNSTYEDQPVDVTIESEEDTMDGDQGADVPQDDDASSEQDGEPASDEMDSADAAEEEDSMGEGEEVSEEESKPFEPISTEEAQTVEDEI